MNKLLRLKSLQRILLLLLFLSLLMSKNLWFGDRFFPSIPAVPVFAEVSKTAEYLLLILFLLSALSLLFTFKSKLLYQIAIASLIGLILIDLNRLQVWSFFFLLLLYSLSFFTKIMKHQKTSDTLFAALQFLLLASYFWVGINKMNSNFFETVLPYVTAPLQHQFQWFIYFEELAYPVPFIQVICIPLLLWKRSRNLTVILMSVFHFLIIVLIGLVSYNQNNIIIPLNLFYIAALFFLFFKLEDKHAARFNLRNHKLSAAALILGIGPVLSWISPYPHNMSMDIYSGRYAFDPIAIPVEKIEHIPEHLSAHTEKFGKSIYFDIYAWSMNELNVPPFYEDYVLDRYESEIVAQCKKK